MLVLVLPRGYRQNGHFRFRNRYDISFFSGSLLKPTNIGPLIANRRTLQPKAQWAVRVPIRASDLTGPSKCGELPG